MSDAEEKSYAEGPVVEKPLPTAEELKALMERAWDTRSVRDAHRAVRWFYPARPNRGGYVA